LAIFTIKERKLIFIANLPSDFNQYNGNTK
jgi:hypothetical protein